MNRTIIPVLSLCLIIIVGICFAGRVYGATNSSYTFFDLTDPTNSKYSLHLYVYTQSTASPEAFSVGMPELPGVLGWDYDEFDIVYQTDTSTGEVTEETVWIWVDTDSDGYPDSLQATVTNCDATNEVWVYAKDIYGK